MDIVVDGDPTIGTQVPFKDLVDKLEMAFMGHVEARGERFGGFFDMVYVDLGSNKTVSLPPPINEDVIVDSGLKMQVYELGGLYRLGRPDPGAAAFDLLLGARQVEIDQRFTLTLSAKNPTPDTASVNISETDIIAGARVVGKFNERWGYLARADYGWGGTEGTLNALAAIGYTFGQTGLFTLDVGYRHTKFELSSSVGEGVTVDTDITMSGPVVGLIFNF